MKYNEGITQSTNKADDGRFMLVEAAGERNLTNDTPVR